MKRIETEGLRGEYFEESYEGGSSYRREAVDKIFSQGRKSGERWG